MHALKDNIKIDVRQLVKKFNNNIILNGVDISINKKSSTVILGCSGSGKSVLIKSIIGLMMPDSGEILIDGVNVNLLNHEQKFGLTSRCGFLFQSGALFDSLTVLDNVTFFVEKLRNLSLSEKLDLAESKLKSVGLSGNILNLYPSELSGGMQKRVSFARTICHDPEIIFFDEPTTGLDPIMSNVINELIIKSKEELGATTITITHDINSAKMIADFVYLLYKGNILWNGLVCDLENSSNQYLDQFLRGLISGPIIV